MYDKRQDQAKKDAEKSNGRLVSLEKLIDVREKFLAAIRMPRWSFREIYPEHESLRVWIDFDQDILVTNNILPIICSIGGLGGPRKRGGVSGV